MSFVLTRTLATRTIYMQLGIYVDAGEKEVTVAYIAREIISLSAGAAVAAFDVVIPDTPLISEVVHQFTYSGQGNPLEEAEASLLASLSAQKNTEEAI